MTYSYQAVGHVEKGKSNATRLGPFVAAASRLNGSVTMRLGTFNDLRIAVFLNLFCYRKSCLQLRSPANRPGMCICKQKIMTWDVKEVLLPRLLRQINPPPLCHVLCRCPQRIRRFLPLSYLDSLHQQIQVVMRTWPHTITEFFPTLKQNSLSPYKPRHPSGRSSQA